MPLTYSVPDAELSATLHNRRSGVIDNIFTGTPFLNAMREKGGVKTEDGGKRLDTPVQMAKNSTAGSFGKYDVLATTPQNNETTASYPWASEYATVSISFQEEKENQGRHAVYSLLNQKIDDAQNTLRDLCNIHFLQAQPSAGSKDPVSITELIDEAPGADPARTDSIGLIGNANTWWRNIATDGGAFTVADMNTMFNDVSDGHDFPTFLFTGQTPFEYYENSLTGQIRYSDTRMADAGFQNLLYKNAPLIWDSQIGNTDEIYFINTDYLKITIHSSADFITTDFVEPANQAAKTAKILVMIQMESNNRRRLGTLHGLTAPA